MITVIFLVAGLFCLYKYTDLKKAKTVDYTSYSNGYIVKGDHLFPDKDTLLHAMEKAKPGRVEDAEFFAENHQVNDSSGVLTAADLWPKAEIERNAKSIILVYLASVLFIALCLISAGQILYCSTVAKG